MYLINGENKHCIDVSDRGFQYGDGLFETLEILNGTPLFFQRHMQRLLQGCEKLLIPAPDYQTLRLEAFQLCRGSQRAVLKIIITRGSGGRGYRQPDCVTPTRVLSLHPYPEYPAAFYSAGIVVRFCQQRLASNPVLAGLKHLNRLEQVLARAEWRDDSVQEGLMLDSAGHVIEGTMSNLFFVKANVLYTADLAECGIAGIARSLLIDCAAKLGIVCVEKAYFADELLEAEEAFVCNSVVGIWPIRQLQDKRFAVGEITRRLQQQLNLLRQAEVEYG